jgi:hypothetical protein
MTNENVFQMLDALVRKILANPPSDKEMPTNIVSLTPDSPRPKKDDSCCAGSSKSNNFDALPAPQQFFFCVATL